MSDTIQARLDEETKAIRLDLRRRLGITDSEMVRRALKALASATPRRGERKLTGIGKHHSGVSDLATNPKYMEGYGE